MRCKQFTDFIHAHTLGVDPHSIHIDKLMTRELVEKSGFKSPKVLFQVDTIHDVDFEKLPDTLVLKLTNQASKRGVFILHKVANGFYEQLSEKIFTQEEIVRRFDSLHTSKTKVIGEKLIFGENGAYEIPYDYKLYTFESGVQLVFQVNRNPKKDEVAFFDGDFVPITDQRVRAGPKKFVSKGNPVRPKNYAEMLAVARRLLKELDRPFVSVDLYTTGEEVYVGELTPTPGASYVGNIFRFSEQFDAQLGQLMTEGYEKRNWAIPEFDEPSPIRKKRSKS